MSDETVELKERVRRLENIILNHLAGDDDGQAGEDSDVIEVTENPDAVENPSIFGLNFGRKQKAAEGARQYYVTFESAAGTVRDLLIKADNKKEALTKAKEWMRDEGENLRGASWEVEVAG